MSVLEEESIKVLLKFLDKKTAQAEKEITEKGTLSDEHAIPLILKILFNHVLHLDKEITELRTNMPTKEEFNDLRTNMSTREEFNDFKKEFNTFKKSLITWLLAGFSIIGILVTVFGLLK